MMYFVVNASISSRKKRVFVMRCVLLCVQEFSEQRFFAFISLCAD